MSKKGDRKAVRKRLIAASTTRALPAPTLLFLPANASKPETLPLPFEDDEFETRREHARKLLLMVCVGAHMIDERFDTLTVLEHRDMFRAFDRDCMNLVSLNLSGEEAEYYVGKLREAIASLGRVDTTLILRLNAVIQAILDEQDAQEDKRLLDFVWY